MARGGSHSLLAKIKGEMTRVKQISHKPSPMTILSCAAIVTIAAALSACDSASQEYNRGGLTADDAKALDEAAAKLDADNALVPPVALPKAEAEKLTARNKPSVVPPAKPPAKPPIKPAVKPSSKPSELAPPPKAK
jgi:hypothetical protein